MDVDDQALVERCRQGELGAFEPLVEKYRERVWRLAYSYLRDREEARDVAQEAFIRAWQGLPSFRGQSAFYTWLFRIAVNIATDRARQRAARGRAFGTEAVPADEWERVVPEGATMDDTAARIERRDRIRRALDTLPEHHRAIIMLSDLEGLAYREIAEVLQIPIGTVMSRLHNARKRLREALGSLLGLLLALLVALAPVPAAAQVARFGAQVMIASDTPPPGGMRLAPTMSPETERLLPRLRQTLRYREYTLLDQYAGEAEVGATLRWGVPGGRQLEITCEAVSPMRLHVRLLRGGVAEVNTRVQVARGRPAVIGGPRHGDGVLLIVVSPAP